MKGWVGLVGSYQRVGRSWHKPNCHLHTFIICWSITTSREPAENLHYMRCDLTSAVTLVVFLKVKRQKRPGLTPDFVRFSDKMLSNIFELVPFAIICGNVWYSIWERRCDRQTDGRTTVTWCPPLVSVDDVVAAFSTYWRLNVRCIWRRHLHRHRQTDRHLDVQTDTLAVQPSTVRHVWRV